MSNTGGATITGGSTAIYAQYNGSVTNGAGSTIKTTGSASGDCGSGGDCAIFVASNTATNSEELVNAGTIIGNVQLSPATINDVTLSAGSSIQGNFDIGYSRLTLNGDAGTVQLYSHAVTGATTFAGALIKGGYGTWIIDNADLATNSITISGGSLQIGNGGVEGSVGAGSAVIYGGSLVFDHSDDVTFNGSISSEHSDAYDGTLVQAGTGVLTLLLGGNEISPTHITIQSGTLQIDNTGAMPACTPCSSLLGSSMVNNGSLIFDSNLNIFYSGTISGAGSVTQNGSAALIMQANNTYTGRTTINQGSLLAQEILPGDTAVNVAGTLDGYSGGGPTPGLPGVAGNLSNAGKVLVHGGDSAIGGDYTRHPRARWQSAWAASSMLLEQSRSTEARWK